jgi:hypothetical protein
MNEEINFKQKTKDKAKLHHENDKTFKVAMTNKETALEYVERYVQNIRQYLDLDYFELDTTNYVAKDFNEFFADVVYRTRLKVVEKVHKKTGKPLKSKIPKAVTIVLLFEHKKSIESAFMMFLQLLEYIILIWREDIKNKRKPSIIVPIVVYQGTKTFKIRQLHQSQPFRGIPKDLLKYIPNFECHFTDIHSIADKDILSLNEKGLLRSLFLAYKYIEHRTEIDNFLLEIFKFLKHDPSKFDFFQLIFEYLLRKDYISTEERDLLFEQYLKIEEKEEIMTTYQVLRQEGRQEGETNKARLVVLRGRWLGLSVNFLANQSELSISLVENLMKGYNKAFQSWQKKEEPTTIEHLTKEEVVYLFGLFEKSQN